MAWFKSKAERDREAAAQSAADRERERLASEARYAEQSKAREADARERLQRSYAAVLAGGTFTGPCSAAEGMAVILRSTDTNGDPRLVALYEEFLSTKAAGGDPAAPPLQAQIQMCEFEESDHHARFLLRAGNRVELYWKYEVELRGTDQMTGSVWITEAMTVPHLMWVGNLQQQNAMIERAIRSIGGTSAVSR